MEYDYVPSHAYDYNNFFFIPDILLAVNSAVNGFIYFFSNKEFRGALVTHCRCVRNEPTTDIEMVRSEENRDLGMERNGENNLIVNKNEQNNDLKMESNNENNDPGMERN